MARHVTGSRRDRSFRFPLLEPFREADVRGAHGDNANEYGPQSRQPFFMKSHGAFWFAHFDGLFFLPSSQSSKITSTSDDSDRRSSFAVFSIATFTSGSTRAPSGTFTMFDSVCY
jgi:hypothetical protein